MRTTGWSDEGIALNARCLLLVNAIESHAESHLSEAAALLHGLLGAARLGVRTYGAEIVQREQERGEVAANAVHASNALPPRAADIVESIRAGVSAIARLSAAEQECAWDALGGFFLSLYETTAPLQKRGPQQ